MTKQDIRTVDLRRLAGHVARRGPGGTFGYLRQLGWHGGGLRLRFYCRLLRVHLFNWSYDLRHGTETRINLPTESFDTSSESLGSAHWYTPIPVHTLRLALRKVSIDYRQYTFIDYGSGKGRALLVASELPFHALVGVEFAGNLLDQAEKNLRQFRSLRKKHSLWDLHLIDARNYMPPVSNCWYFLYAPFYGEVLDQVMHNIYLASKVHAGDAFLCFMDDRIPSGMAASVERTLEGWAGWQAVDILPPPFDVGGLHPIDIVLYRTVDANIRQSKQKLHYSSPRLGKFGSIQSLRC